jgi:Flp pilus assembly pilin Flp
MDATVTTETTRNLISETGQTMAEYAVVLSVIIFVTVAVFILLGDSVVVSLQAVRKIFP